MQEPLDQPRETRVPKTYQIERDAKKYDFHTFLSLINAWSTPTRSRPICMAIMIVNMERGTLYGTRWVILSGRQKKLLTIEKKLFFGLKTSCVFSTSQLHTGFSVFMNKWLWLHVFPRMVFSSFQESHAWPQFTALRAIPHKHFPMMSRRSPNSSDNLPNPSRDSHAWSHGFRRTRPLHHICIKTPQMPYLRRLEPVTLSGLR